MDRERAETFLRLLAETELRRATARPGDRVVVAGCITRVMRVVRVLTVVGALGDELAGQVLDDFELDLGTRGSVRPASTAGRCGPWCGHCRRGSRRTRPTAASLSGR